MDSKQFAEFMGKFQEMIGSLKKAPAAPVERPAAVASVPLPPPLELDGDMERNFDFFEESWKYYASAVGMDKWPEAQNEQKTSILLSVVGTEALKKYFNFELTAVEKKDPKLALAAIKRKVVRERNKFIDWFDFFSLSQGTEERIDDYLCRLKSQAKMCKFGVLEEDLLKYKLVTSIKWLKLRTKLLTMQNLTEAQAVDFCRAEEIAEQHPISEQRSASVNKVKKHAKNCKFCGEMHDFTKGSCPAFGKRCYRCGGKNHFEAVCKAERRKKLKRKSRVQKVLVDSSTDGDLAETESTSSESATIGKVSDGSGGHVEANLDMCIAGKWQSVQCELDTGANASLVGHSWLQRMTGRAHSDLQPSKYRLHGFGGGEIPVIGQTTIRCRQYGRKYNLVLQVVDVEQGPLLSAHVCRTLGFLEFGKMTRVNMPVSTKRSICRIEAQCVGSVAGQDRQPTRTRCDRTTGGPRQPQTDDPVRARRTTNGASCGLGRYTKFSRLVIKLFASSSHTSSEQAPVVFRNIQHFVV
ncbi:uncharacterized protein LOC120429748 [Culex pipiens pallens]|uniref:uncharacterized protein LOC120429748 n=1 Tax=Culex pipiens pallens TaxID=42434 RepID=UPI001954425C|nr:uncharacterized protein LOC120429748 [Culex pipiens pallens]